MDERKIKVWHANLYRQPMWDVFPWSWVLSARSHGNLPTQPVTRELHTPWSARLGFFHNGNLNVILRTIRHLGTGVHLSLSSFFGLSRFHVWKMAGRPSTGNVAKFSKETRLCVRTLSCCHVLAAMCSSRWQPANHWQAFFYSPPPFSRLRMFHWGGV